MCCHNEPDGHKYKIRLFQCLVQRQFPQGGSPNVQTILFQALRPHSLAFERQVKDAKVQLYACPALQTPILHRTTPSPFSFPEHSLLLHLGTFGSIQQELGQSPKSHHLGNKGNMMWCKIFTRKLMGRRWKKENYKR